MTQAPIPSPNAPVPNTPAPGLPAHRQWGRASLVFGSAVVLWFVWLGWDTTYDVDPETGRLSGPYAWGQVAGFVFSAAGLVLAARRFLPALPVVAAAALGITGGFALSAGADDSGLAGIGVALMLPGSAAGGALVLSLAGPALTCGRRRGQG